MPLPVDLRQAAQGIGPQAVPAEGQAASHARQGQEVEGVAHPDARAHRGPFGHYESDTVVGASPSRRCIDTQVERRSRRLFARFVPDKSALATARAEYDWPGVAIAA